MIYRLQRRFILISAISIFLVVALVWGIIVSLHIVYINKNMDMLAQSISNAGGSFPIPDGTSKPNEFFPDDDRKFNFITPETPFSTRHFTVIFNHSGKVESVRTESIYSISSEEAIQLANKVIERNKMKGWISNYRYRFFITERGYGIVFVDGSMVTAIFMQSITIAGIVLLFCAAIVLLLIVILSKRAIKPIADSYEKQKQFVTDANHELKTPLTLILTNVDIAESELGQNEWLDDIREEGNRMTELVNQLVSLSRMDEENHSLNISTFDLSNMVFDTSSEFEMLATQKDQSMTLDVENKIVYSGDSELIKRLLGILLDNAVKYCDSNGEINITLKKKKGVVLTVENTYSSVNNVELEKMFDRFYRADKARTYTGGYGIGLSIAKSIVEKHNGSIVSYKKDDITIGVKVTLK